MPTDIILDSSLIIALVVPEEHSSMASERISEYDYYHILDLSYYEVANGIKTKVLKKEINSPTAVEAFTKAVKFMNLCVIHSFSELIADALRLSLELDITSYDSAFLSLSDITGSKLLTLDSKLAQKIKDTNYHKVTVSPPKPTK